MKTKVLFVIFQMKMGGSERLVHNLALNLDPNFFEPRILWLYGGEISREFKDLGIPLYYAPKIKRFDFNTMRKIANVIKDQDIHIVNAHHFMPMFYSYYGAKVANKTKLIYTEHSEWEIRNIKWKWRRIGSYLLKHADATVGVNPNVTNTLKNVFDLDSSETVTIENGVNLKDFYQDIGKKAELKKEIRINAKDRIIGIVANFRKIKNHLFLLKAFNELRTCCQDVKLLLIGQGYGGNPVNSEKEIEDFVESNGLGRWIVNLGYRSDVPDLLGIMDVFCLTSYKEGLPISLIEAMAAGLPVVGTNVEGIRDVIIEGKNGFLVQIDDTKDLKDALYSLIQNEPLRQKMGQESARLARKKYSFQRCISKYEQLFSIDS